MKEKVGNTEEKFKRDKTNGNSKTERYLKFKNSIDELNSTLEITKDLLIFTINKQKLYSLKEKENWIENNE